MPDLRLGLPESKNINRFWKKDYKEKTGVAITQPRKQGLSRNHRISDHDIKMNIIHDINHHFKENLIQSMCDVFPWSEENLDKNKAKSLLKNLKIETDLKKRVEVANELHRLLSGHCNNISYGNAKQNLAIGERLDLNAPCNDTGKHSLTTRSRHILETHNKKNGMILLTPPKTTNDKKIIYSSQYGIGGDAHKEGKNIVLENTSPKTKTLLTDFFAIRDQHEKKKTQPVLHATQENNTTSPVAIPIRWISEISAQLFQPILRALLPGPVQSQKR